MTATAAAPAPLEVAATAVDIAEAERICGRLARRHAANFYWGFLALPREQRTAVYALYDFARQVDDAVDGVDPVEAGPRLDWQRARLHAGLAGSAADPVMAVLVRAVERFGIPPAEVEALVDGVAADLVTTRYASWDDLAGYCRLVASTVGRMCVRIFGYDDERALDHADDLGMALQLTNILRDVREDAAMGRVYLPAEDLALFGVDPASVAAGVEVDGWRELVRFEARRAARLFASGLRVTGHLQRRPAVCVVTMAGIYRRILDDIDHNPWVPLQRRVSVPARAKASVMLNAWAGRWPR